LMLGRASQKTKPNLLYLPSFGQHKFYYKGKLLMLNRSKGNPTLSSNSERGLSVATPEFLTITLFHYNRSILNDLVQEAMDKNFDRSKDKTRIYATHSGMWMSIAMKEKRELSSVVLEESVSGPFERDILFFLRAKEWYAQRGIPYRRGYLLHGPPGTGKTSFILAIAGKLGLDICMLNTSGQHLNDSTLLTLLQQTPRDSIVVLEDIDSMFVKRKSDFPGSSISFAGLLNALDGIASADGRILFMTTNHITRLSPALIRPGRIDKKFLFDFASRYQIQTMFEQFFGQEKHVLEIVLEKVGDRKITTAQLQGWFIEHSDDAESLLLGVDGFVEDAVKENNRKDEDVELITDDDVATKEKEDSKK